MYIPAAFFRLVFCLLCLRWCLEGKTRFEHWFYGILAVGALFCPTL